MNTGVVILGVGGLALAGAGLYVAVRHEPTPRERLIDAALSPVEAVSGAVSTGITIAPYIPLLVIVGVLLLAALLIFVVGPAFGRGLASTAVMKAGK